MELEDCLIDSSGVKEVIGSIGYGAAVAVHLGEVTLTRTRFTNNKGGLTGGALYLTRSRRVTIQDCDFINNSVQSNGNGAGILMDYVRGNVITISGGKFEGNSYHSGSAVSKLVRGSGIYMSYSPGSISGTSFSKNDAGSGDGGAIYLIQSSVQLDSISCSSNRAEASGGCLTVYGQAQAHVTNSSFADNTAGFGLHIALSSYTFLGNTYWGAVDCKDSSSSTFSNPTASGGVEPVQHSNGCV